MTPFYGKYRGIVTDNDDPTRMGRIRATVPDVLGTAESGWAAPCAPFAGKAAGFFALPPVGAFAWIEFEFGDPSYPIWSGGLWGGGQMAPAVMMSPKSYVVILTPGGASITLSDLSGAEGITLQTTAGAKIAMTSTGIEIDNGQGATIKLSGPQVSINNGALDVT